MFGSLLSGLQRLRALFNKRRLDDDFDQEVQAHITLLTEEHVSRGMAPEEARYAALRSFGGVTQVKESNRQLRGMHHVETLMQDTLYGVRILRKNPAFTAVVVLTLALGIGANTAMFSVVNGVVLQPLPYEDPSRLVMLWTDLHSQGLEKIEVSAPEYTDFRDNARIFAGLAAFAGGSMTLTGRGDAERLISCSVTPNLFSVLEARQLHGRTFVPAEGTPGHDHVAVLSYGLWQSRFGADPAVLGQTIALDQSPYTVVGIMPRDFAFPDRDTKLWTPQVLTADLLSENNRGSHFLELIGRLAPGITPAQAQAQLAQLSERIGRDHPRSYPRGYGAHLTSLQSEIVGDSPRALWILLAAVGIVLLIACSNAANLLLARATSRRREVALRSALGATRVRVVRQLLTESSLLALAGGAAGLLLAGLALPALLRLGGADVPRADEVHINWTVIAFNCAVSIGTVVFFGFIPALQSSAVNLQVALKEGANTGYSPHTGLRNFFVVVQMAAALALVVAAGLLVHSFLNVTRVDSGFAPSRLLTFRVSVVDQGFSRRVAFYSELLERLSARAGVQAVGAVNALPFSGFGGDRSFVIEGRPEVPGQRHPDEQLRFVSTSYFRTLGIPLLRGRDFSPHDNADAPRVVVVNQAFVDRYWPSGGGLGQHIAYGESSDHKPTWCEIVGVVANIHHSGLESEQKAEVYLPMLQPLYSVSESTVPNMFIAVRTSTDPTEFAAQVRSELTRLDPGTPLSNLMTMEDRIEASQSPRRLRTLLLGTFACLALLLAAIGTYGVIAYTVQQRRQEFGIRIALGAPASGILWLVLMAGGRLVLIGAISGALLAAAFTRVLAALLFHVSPTDPLSFASGIVFLAAVALAACCIPALRAMRTDPAEVLRNE